MFFFVTSFQIVLTDGSTLSAGFRSVAVEDSTTLLDAAINIIDELSDVYTSDSSDRHSETEKEMVTKTLLKKLFATMSDRSSVNKCFSDKFNVYRKEKLGTDLDLKFLFCNAHFLLGLANSCEQTLKQAQNELGKIGRDACSDGRFSRFKSSSESAGSRFVRTASDVLGPRGDKKKWLSSGVAGLL